MEILNSINKKKNPFKISIIICSSTLLFFFTSIGKIFYKAFTDPNPPQTDNGLGMAYLVFGTPFLLTVVTLLTALVGSYLFKKEQNEYKVFSFFANVLSIPVFLFGLLCIGATVYGIMKGY